MAELVATLREKQGRSDTRQAVAQIFSRTDLKSGKDDVPCTTTLQFLPRRGKLHMVVTMRSNDAYRGFPHDAFAFSFIQEFVARQLAIEVGTYCHFVGSMHLYDEDIPRAHDFLNEGYQTPMCMPPMPASSPDAALTWLLRTEEAIRLGLPEPDSSGVDPYWQDLARLLRVKSLHREKRMREIATIRKQMSTEIYNSFIRGKELTTAQKSTVQPALPGILRGPAVLDERESEEE